MKNTFRINGFFLLAVLAGAVLLAGCEEKFKWDLPLALMQRAVTLDSDAGSTHVLVYSTGDWTLHFTDPEAVWAAIDRVQGSGNGEFVFSYTENYDYDRSVGVVVSSGSLRDTVVFTQTGRRSSPTYSLALSSVELLKAPQTVSIPVSSTNILYDFSIFTVSATYYDRDGVMLGMETLETRSDDIPHEDDVVTGWIYNPRVTLDALLFDVTLNTLPYVREAYVSVNFSGGSSDSDSGVFVYQSPSAPVFVLDSAEGEYDSQSRGVTVPASYNNISFYADEVVFDVSYPDGSGSEAWIQSPSISEAGLTFGLAANGGEAERHGVISFSYTDSIGETVSGTYSVTQLSE